MPNKIQFIRDLLTRFGSPAEQAAVRDVHNFGQQAGREKIILGSTIDPAFMTQNEGSNTGVGFPSDWNDKLLSLRPDPMFSAHNHPSAAPLPSRGDIGTWTNQYHPGAGGPGGSLTSDADAARARMWITAPSLGPTAQSLIEPFPHSGNLQDDADLSDRLLARARMAENWGYGKGRRLQGLLRDFSDSWGIPMPQTADEEAWYNANMHFGIPTTDLAQHVPFYMDPAQSIYKGSRFNMGDVMPEWLKYAQDKGYNAYSSSGQAKGGQARPDENEFQAFMAFDPSVRAWRRDYANRYGEQPNTQDDPTFDYREAYTAGNRPRPYAGDQGHYHWDSRGKAPDHPTEWMNDFMQQFGVDPMEMRADQVTPDIQRYMTGQIGKTAPADTFDTIFDALTKMGAYR